MSTGRAGGSYRLVLHPAPWTSLVLGQLTPRLDLRPVVPGDAAALFPILSDPAGWWYDEAGRHRSPATTARWCERAAERWASDGLSYWTVRDIDTGEVIGVGGAQRQRTGNWNLNYRIAGHRQRQGLAVELAQAAKDAALSHDPSVAVVAWVAEHNVPSRRVAERVGLIDRGPKVDPSDGQTRHAYSDRPLDDPAA
jgi:RimJ/RimL family protein N-acetyltransferase